MAHVLTTLQLLSLYAAISFMPIDRRTFGMIVASVVISGTIAGIYGAYLFHDGVDVSKNGRLFIQNDNQIIDPNQFAGSLIFRSHSPSNMIVQAKTTIFRIAAGWPSSPSVADSPLLRPVADCLRLESRFSTFLSDHANALRLVPSA